MNWKFWKKLENENTKTDKKYFALITITFKDKSVFKIQSGDFDKSKSVFDTKAVTDLVDWFMKRDEPTGGFQSNDFGYFLKREDIRLISVVRCEL